MTRVFFDTEFTDLCADARLISIGLVDERGEQSFYAEISDAYTLQECSDFTREFVVPQLEGRGTRMPMREVADRLAVWLERFREPVTLATDSYAWDWPWILDMFRHNKGWPDNLDHHPLLLTINHLVNFDAFELAVEEAFAAGLRRHHSLDDARANRLGWISAEGDFDWKARTLNDSD